jgi:hypothetical protein
MVKYIVANDARYDLIYSKVYARSVREREQEQCAHRSSEQIVAIDGINRVWAQLCVAPLYLVCASLISLIGRIALHQ